MKNKVGPHGCKTNSMLFVTHLTWIIYRTWGPLDQVTCRTTRGRANTEFLSDLIGLLPTRSGPICSQIIVWLIWTSLDRITVRFLWRRIIQTSDKWLLEEDYKGVVRNYWKSTQNDLDLNSRLSNLAKTLKKWAQYIVGDLPRKIKRTRKAFNKYLNIEDESYDMIRSALWKPSSKNYYTKKKPTGNSAQEINVFLRGTLTLPFSTGRLLNVESAITSPNWKTKMILLWQILRKLKTLSRTTTPISSLLKTPWPSTFSLSQTMLNPRSPKTCIPNSTPLLLKIKSERLFSTLIPLRLPARMGSQLSFSKMLGILLMES